MAYGIKPVGEILGVIVVRGLLVRGDEGRQEVVLDHGRPAVGDVDLCRPVSHVVETDFVVAFLRAGQHGASVGVEQHPAGSGRIVALDLGVLPPFPIGPRTVFHLVAQADAIGAALQFEYLGDDHALFRDPA